MLVVLLLATVLVSVSQTAEAAQRRSAYAITGATVITAPGNAIENATVVLRDGLIEAVGSDIAAPPDARVIDASGMTVYAGWIDAYSEVAIEQEATAATLTPGRGGAQRGSRGGGQQAPQMLELGSPGVNQNVHPEYVQADHLTNEDSSMAGFRDAGFTAALVVPQAGIYRGQSVLIALRDTSTEEMVLRDNVTQAVGFATGGFGRGYPSSSMGVMALIRQILLDTQRQATWENSYNNDPTGIPRPETNPAYTALMPALAGNQQVIFDATTTRAAKRGLDIAQEFGLAVVIKGNGNEFEMADQLAAARVGLIIPVDFPDKPTLSDDDDANLDVGLAALQRWEDAPGNGAALERAGVVFAFTADGVSPGEFAANVRKAIEAGLSEAAALAAVTTNPATMFGVESIVGTIEPGKIANVVVASGAPFAEDTEVRHVFVDGVHTEVEESAAPARGGRGGDGPANPLGTWAVTMGADGFSQDMTWRITGEAGAYAGTFDGEPFDSVSFSGNKLTVAMTTPMGQMSLAVNIRGDSLSGDLSMQGFTIGVDGRRTSGPGLVDARREMNVDHGGQQ